MQLYIDGLSETTKEKDIIPIMSDVVSLVSVKVIRDIVTGKSRGFALAMINDLAEGRKAIAKINGTLLKGKKLTVFQIHETLNGEMEFREWLRDNADEILKKVGILPLQTIVDYGCGPGIFSLAATRIVGRQGKVYALDVRSQSLAAIREIAVEDELNNLETILIEKSVVPVSLKEGIVDVVILYDVLQEIVDKPKLLTELYSVLKTNGTLSVFPMHLGTAKFLDMMDGIGLFQVRDTIGYPGFESASNIVNLTKR
jgi:SAM-dependent methyltransferase